MIETIKVGEIIAGRTVIASNSRTIQHRGGEQGPRIGRVDIVEFDDGSVKRMEFWYQWETGRLLYVR